MLYGDYHATWYGDPQQRIIWWNSDQSSYLATWAVDTNAYSRYNYNTYPGMPKTLPEIFHQLDVGAGVDVDAPLSKPSEWGLGGQVW